MARLRRRRGLFPRPSARTLSLGLGALALMTPLPASAVAGEWHTGARLGIATLSGANLGPAFDVHGAYELSDFFDAVVQVTGSRHGGTPGADAFAITGGLNYKIDVFQWIPYAGVQGGYYRYVAPAGAGYGSAQASLHAGLDYLLMRQVAVGFDFGFHHFFTDQPHTLGTTALIGAEYRFGW